MTKAAGKQATWAARAKVAKRTGKAKTKTKKATTRKGAAKG